MPSAVSIRMCRLIGAKPLAASIWSSSVATNSTSAGRAHLGDQDRVQLCAGPLDHLDDVAVAPVRVEAVDAHGDGAGRPVLLVQRGDHVLAGLLLVVRRDGVLEVEEDDVGAQRRRLLERAGVAAGHRQLAAVQAIAHRHQPLPAVTAERGGVSTESNACQQPVGGLAVSVGAHHADPPDVGRVRSQPAADLDVVLAQQPALDLLAVDALGHAHGGQLRELQLRVGKQLVAALAQPGLKVRAGVQVALPAGLEALLERQSQPLVECVVLDVGGGVVVGGGPLDPVAGELLEVEAERHRRRSRGDPLHRPRRERDRRDAGRRAQALLAARVAVVDAPALGLELDAAERGDAVGHQQRVAVAQLRGQLRQRVGDAGRRLGVHDGDQPRLGMPLRAPRGSGRSTPPGRTARAPRSRSRPGGGRSRSCGCRRSRSFRRWRCRRARPARRGRPPCRTCRWRRGRS